MARKRKTLFNYISENIENNDLKKIKGVIGTFDKPEDFLTILTILDNNKEDKSFSLKINYYESLFKRFLLISDLFNTETLKKQDWHKWTVIISEISNVLWRFRGNFSPPIWIETIKKIYEISFKTMGNVEPKKAELNFEQVSDSKRSECGNCSKLFSNLFSHLSEHASVDDINMLSLPSLKEIIAIYEDQVGVHWDNCHYKIIIESKFSALENTM